MDTNFNSPRSLHAHVNSAASNVVVAKIRTETNVVNEIAESWSLPWHAMQRSVAKSLDSVSTCPGIHPMSRAAAGWLVRARSSAVLAHQPAR